MAVQISSQILNGRLNAPLGRLQNAIQEDSDECILCNFERNKQTWSFYIVLLLITKNEKEVVQELLGKVHPAYAKMNGGK
jgi:hypothetical protein